MVRENGLYSVNTQKDKKEALRLSDIFKKITSIEPVDEDALDALNISSSDTKPRQSLLRPLPEDMAENDPVPEFITRQSDVQTDSSAPEPILSEPIKSEPISTRPIESAPAIMPAIAAPAAYIARDTPAPSTGWMKWAGILSVLIWLGASFAYVYGSFDLGRKLTDLTPIQIAGLILAVLLPAVLLGLFFYTLRQLSIVSAQAHKLGRAAHALTQPDDSVIAKTATMSQAASASTAQTADEVASRLSTQRIALETIAGTFDNRMEMLTSMLNEQSGKLEASTQLAEHKIQEARVSIDGAAEKINAASDVVKGNTVEAASTLTKSHEEIEGLAEMIRARSAELDEVYRKHAQDLTTMIGQLRDEQQDMSISLEERLTKMRDMSLSAKVSAESLTEASQAGKQTVQALAEATRLTDTAVKQRFAEMENMVKFSGEKAESISDRAPKKRARIRLKPLEEDFPPVEPPREPIKTAPIESAPTEPAPLTLRPTPKTEAVFEPAPTPQQTVQSPNEDALELLDELSLEVEPLDLTADIAPIDPDADIKAFTPEVITPQNEDRLRPAAPPSDEDIVGFGKKKSKGKPGWRWRDMLGGLDRPDDVQTSAEPMREISDQRMMASLANLGLTPAAIVDDGCIIEAANTRKTKGAIAMSQAVASRMGDPIRHLNRAMEENPALKTDARAYVTQFKARMSAIENDREAIRTRLESDAGRAFLLCDAALNG